MGNEPTTQRGHGPLETPNSPRGAISPTGNPFTIDQIRQRTDSLLSNSSVFLSDVRSALDIRAQLQKRTFYPLTGLTLEDLITQRQWTNEYKTPADWKAAIINYITGKDLQHAIVTADGRALDAIWVDAPQMHRGLTVVIFHANAMVGLDMFNYAEWYRRQGCDVLVVTMGGYGDSTGVPGELSSYMDAAAAVEYCLRVRKVPPHRLVLHGLSLGGALAASGGTQFPGVHVVLDQTFTSAAAVSHSVIEKQATWVPGFVVEQAVSTMFPEGRSDPCAPGLCTDGYNTVQKIRRLKGQLFVITARQDDMMPRWFGADLIEARYGLMEARKQARHHELAGGHCSMFETDTGAVAAMVKFLDELVGAAVNLEALHKEGVRGECDSHDSVEESVPDLLDELEARAAKARVTTTKSNVADSGKWDI